MSNLYYTPPSQEIFDEVKNKAMELWKAIDTDNDKYGYTTEKINRIKDLENVSDNFMSIIAMFSLNNQILLAHCLSRKECKEIRKRMIDSGMNEEYIVF